MNAGLTLEALCEITAERDRWDEVPGLVAAAREEAEVGEQLTLPLFAARLEGRAAAAAGDVPRAAELLGSAAAGFAAIGAQWEEARSLLMLAVAVGERAERALPVLERLGSAREIKQARSLQD